MLVVVIGAFYAASLYLKRGVQGRWKIAVDDLGDQYDPRLARTSINQILMQNIETTIVAQNVVNGFWTLRVDTTNSIELKRGTANVMGY